MSLESVAARLFDFDPVRSLSVGNAMGNQNMQIAHESQRQMLDLGAKAASAALQKERNDLAARSQMMNEMMSNLNRFDKMRGQNQAAANNAAIGQGSTGYSTGSTASSNPVSSGVETLPASSAEIGSPIGQMVGGATEAETQVSIGNDIGFNSGGDAPGMFSESTAPESDLSFQSANAPATNEAPNPAITLSGDAPVVESQQSFSVPISGTAHKNQLDVPFDGTAANVRYNNPGASYPRERDNLFGLEGYGVIGGGHLIGKYPTPVHGAASNMDLFANGYRGMTFGDAVRKWRGGNGTLDVPEGFDANATVDDSFLSDRGRMSDFFSKMAAHESTQFSMPIEDWQNAFDMYRAGGVKSSGGDDFRSRFGEIVTEGTTASREGGLEYLHPEMKQNFTSLMDSAPEDVRDFLRINSAYRSVSDQEQIEGGRPRATVASPGKSFHQYGLAIDLGDPDGKLLNAKNGGKHKEVVDWLHENAPKHGLNMRLSYHKGGGLVEDWQIEHAKAPQIASNRSREAAIAYENEAKGRIGGGSNRTLNPEATFGGPGFEQDGGAITMSAPLPEQLKVQKAQESYQSTLAEKSQNAQQLSELREQAMLLDVDMQSLDNRDPNYRMRFNQMGRKAGQLKAQIADLEGKQRAVIDREKTLTEALVQAEAAAEIATEQQASFAQVGASVTNRDEVLDSYFDADSRERAKIRLRFSDDNGLSAELKRIDEFEAEQAERDREARQNGESEPTYKVGTSEYTFDELVEFRETEVVQTLLQKDPKLNAAVNAAAGRNRDGGITIQAGGSGSRTIGTGSSTTTSLPLNPVGSGNAEPLPGGSFSTDVSASSPEAGSLFINSIR